MPPKPSTEQQSTITVDELAHALENSTPYPIELHSDMCHFMAERLLEMLTIHKQPDHDVWQPEDPPPPGPEPVDPAVLKVAVQPNEEGT